MVLAYKVISGVTVQKQFECGTFDLLQETSPGNGWIEISRDCDVWLPSRWSLYPYASGSNGGYSSSTSIKSPVKFRKYFPNETDDTITELDFSDINGGFLPVDMCSDMDIIQSGKVIPCEGLTWDRTISKVYISSAWQVPGAAYEGKFFAPPFA